MVNVIGSAILGDAMIRLLGFISILCAFSGAAAEEDAESLGQKFLNTMGGDIWADVRTVHNTAINHHPQARLPYIQEYWYDTKQPAHYVTINNFDLDRVRAYTAQGGWSIAENNFSHFSEERLQREIVSWSRSLYRKLHLLARQDENLTLAIGEAGRLEFFYDDEFIGWFLLDSNGAPTRHGGTPSSENYTNFERLAQFGAVSWPQGGHDNDGWRFEMLSLDVSEDAPAVDYSVPAGQD